jgi:hypothetical protein
MKNKPNGNLELRIAMAQACGWVWYRMPGKPSDRGPMKCLFLPAIHEYDGQYPSWLIRSDGTERMCNEWYLTNAALVPDYPNDSNAIEGALSMLTEEERCNYVKTLLDLVVEAGKPTRQNPLYGVALASRRERCIAFLKAKGVDASRF